MAAIVKGSLWYTFRSYWAVSFVFAVIGECSGIFACYFISHLIHYLRDDAAPVEEGIKLLAVFVVVYVISTLSRQFYTNFGFMTTIRMRRTLVAVIFDKVVNLSMKSLIATNSGKLISVISSDLFAAERGLQFAPILLAAPLVNAFAYAMIGLSSSWINSLIVLGVWIFMLLLQVTVGKLSRKVRFEYSACNDERLKLVNDMVVGVRTLKSYGWEQHYVKKIVGVRQRQRRFLFRLLFMQTLGFNLFQTLALMAAFLIYFNEWQQGNEIGMATSVSTLALVFYLFVTVNQFAFSGLF